MEQLSGQIVQSSINFSEGRRDNVILAIVGAVKGIQETFVTNYSADPDHNRMVLTLLGSPQGIRQAVLAASRVAVAHIDLRRHTGVHPRIGAVDVVPVTPIQNVYMEECVLLAQQIGEDLARELHLPVFFYELNASPDRTGSLPDIRKGGFERLLQEGCFPDLGPQHSHESAGAVVVGARPALVAWNIRLDGPHLAIARAAASQIRRERCEVAILNGVRALGLLLPSTGIAQISMNLTRPAESPMPAVFDYVQKAVEEHEAHVLDSEVIGLIPRSALNGEGPERIRWSDYHHEQIIDNWLKDEEVLDIV